MESATNFDEIVGQLMSTPNHVPPQDFETISVSTTSNKRVVKPVEAKKKTKKQEKEEKLALIKREDTPFHIAEVPDDLRLAIVRGRIFYKSEFDNSNGKTAQKQHLYKKLIGDYVKNKVFGDYNVDLITPGTVANILANEKKRFFKALENIKKSGGAGNKFVYFEVYFDLWKSEPKATELFRDKIGTNTELEWNMVIPEVEIVIEGAENTDDYLEMLKTEKENKKGKKNGKTNNQNEMSAEEKQFFDDHHENHLLLKDITKAQLTIAEFIVNGGIKK